MQSTEQYDLQQEILRQTGMNLITCGNCGSTLIQKKDQTVIVCPDCGMLGEPCDSPDLNNISDEPVSTLYQYAKKQELILEEIYLNGDTEEINPNEVYCHSFQTNTEFDEPSLVREENELILMYSVSEQTKKVRIWVLKELQDVIAEKYRDVILKSRLSKVTTEDEVSLGDIFMHGGYTKEINYNEWDKLIQKRWNHID